MAGELQTPKGLKTTKNVPVDAWYGPYADLATARAAISTAMRLYRTVGVIEGSGVVEYVWKNGTADGDLVLKNPVTFTPENSANKGIAGGYASLDGGAKVPASQLPSYVDDVLEYANFAAFPGAGETGKIYIALDTNSSYRWSGSVYVLIATPFANASETVAGIVEEGTDAEVQDSGNTGTGGTGARLFVAVNKLWNWWTYVKGQAQTISGAWKFAAQAATNITSNISGGAVTIAAASNRETEVYLTTNSNLNISWTNLNEGGIIYLRIERTTNTQISVNFNGSSNADCFTDGSTQQIASGSPLLLAGHNGAVGINRRHYRLSIEAVKDITANKNIYLVRHSDTGSITVS